MIAAPVRINNAYQALCDLGLSLVATSHKWTNEQRKAWERAERALRPLVNPNVEVSRRADNLATENHAVARSAAP